MTDPTVVPTKMPKPTKSTGSVCCSATESSDEPSSERQSECSRPAAIETTRYLGRSMRQLVATTDLSTGRRVAVYPVEVVSDDDEFDDTYAVQLYAEVPLSGGRTYRRPLESVSGIPTEKSLAQMYVDGLPTVAMFANEPGPEQTPNCRFRFPTLPRGAAAASVGDVHCGYLETITRVRSGTPLTWCYGPTYVDRGYPTSCSSIGVVEQWES